MSIQDDIFDVADALKGKPEAEAFDRICQHYFEVENNEEINGRILADIGRGLSALMAVYIDEKERTKGK
jgi:hypothetical protein